MYRPRTLSRSIATVVAAAAIVSGAVGTLAQPHVDARPNQREEPLDTLDRTRYADPIDILSVGVDFVASPGGGTFFEEYARLGGERGSLDAYLAPSMTARLAFTDHLRITAYASVHSAGFEESYDVRSGDDPRVPALAGIAENLSVFAVPVLAGIEFAPIRTQFTSYVGLGAGLALGSTQWQSTTQYSEGGYVRPGENVDAFGVSPAFRAYAGVDLRFDSPSESRATFRGIYLEASYLYLPIAHDYFSALRARGEGIAEGPASDDATLFLGGLSFTFGLNLQVLRR